GATPFPYTTLFRSIETSADVRRNPFVHGGLSRVGERSDAMGAVEGRDHLFGRRPGARDERGTACRKPAVECFARVDDVTGGHHRTRDLWTPDRPAALLTRLRDERLRRTTAVGGGGVEVEVDNHRADARCEPVEPGRGSAFRLRPCRLTSARYSRTSRSRCSRSSSANSRKICLPSESSKRSPYFLKKRCELRSQRMPMSSAC